MNEKTKTRTSFQHLRIWVEAHQLMLIVYSICNKLPKDEFRTIDQAKRSSSSVPDNIAECTGTYYYKDKIKCLVVSRKEATETQNHIISFTSRNLIDKNFSEELVGRYQGLIIGINMYKRKIIDSMEAHDQKKH